MTEEKQPVWVRIFTALFAGYMAFFFIHAAVNSLLVALGITPYGRFVAQFYKGRSKEEATAFIEANRALYDAMLPAATAFIDLAVTPAVGLIAGMIIGAITATAWRSGLKWTVIASAPVLLFFWGRSERDAMGIVHAAMLFALMTAGGFAGDRLARKKHGARGAA
ncbi:MAG: hypothetical protein HY894_03440 [Deltaproteobacteria bacterium]|nr:hypothetical protein [Deltaproteobacteria bacterium]